MASRTGRSGAPSAGNPAYKWQVVALLWLVCCFNYADRQAIFAVFPKLKAEFGFGPVQLGLIGSAFAWTYAFGSPLAGFLGDRLSRKRLIVGGCCLWSALTCLTGACSRFWQFVTLQAAVGSGETVYFPSSVSLMSDYHGPETRSRALSLHQSGVYVGTIVGSWLGAVFAVHFGWRMGFVIFGAAGMVLSLVLVAALRDIRRGAEGAGAARPDAGGEPVRPVRAGEALRLIAAKPTAWLLMAVFVGANFVATIFLAWTPTFLVEKFGFKLVAAGLSGTLYIHLASAFSSPTGGWLADRFARRHPGGRILVQASGLLVGACFVVLVGTTDRVGVLLAGMTLFGICKGLYDSNIWASLYDVIEPRARGTATGLGNTVGWAGGALGPVFVGLFTKYGHHATAIANMSAAIAWGGAIYLVCGVALVAGALLLAPRDKLRAATFSQMS